MSPLSIGQDRLFRIARLEPDAPLYNVAAAYRLDGALDLDALARAVRRIAERHEPLRARFWQEAETAACAVSASAGPGIFARSDLSGLPPEEREGALARLLEAEAGQAFDLAEGRLWRVHIARMGDRDHALCLAMHHIVTDGWSFAVLLTELQELYDAEREGREPVLPELGIGYGDFADRQRRLVDSEAGRNQMAYWAERFAKPAPAIRLPGMARDRASSDRHCDVVPFALSAQATRALSAFSQKERVTLFMTLLAAFSALLARASGQKDLLVVTPVTGRHLAQTRHLIGYFNNLLPLRLDVAGAQSLRDVLAVVREAALSAYRNQDAPFRAVSALAGLRGVPLSRLLFSFDMPWPPDFALSGIGCAPIPLDTGTADFDVGLSLWLRDDRLHGALRYKAALFEAETMKALAQSYVRAIETLVQDPDGALAALPLEPGLAATPPPSAPPPVPTGGTGGRIFPRDAIELKVAREWEAAFGTAPIGIDEDLVSLGASSLAVADLADRIQRAFGVAIPLSGIFRAGCIRNMADLLRSSDAPASRSPVAAIRAQGSRPPLFLCEGVGIYYPLAERLGPDQPVYALFSDFDGDYGGVKDLAARYLGALRKVQPQGPYQLGGISFGGLVAFEMARQLRLAGQEVALLALFDTPGPGAYTPKGRAGRLVGHLGNLLRFGMPYGRRVLGRRAARAVSRADRARDRPAQPERRTQQVRALFQDKAGSYQVDPYPGRIALFMIDRRDGMSDSLFDPALGRVDPFLGWQAVAEQGVDRHFLQGEHVTILSEPFVAALARLLDCMLLRPAGDGAPAARHEPAV